MEMIGFVGDFEVSDSAVGPGALFSFGNLGTDACFVPREMQIGKVSPSLFHLLGDHSKYRPHCFYLLQSCTHFVTLWGSTGLGTKDVTCNTYKHTGNHKRTSCTSLKIDATYISFQPG